MPDRQFENEQFNRDWSVMAGSPRFAHDTLQPRVMELFLAAPREVESLWTERDHVFVQLNPAAESVGEVDRYLEFLTRFVALIPAFVWADVGAAPVHVTDDGPGSATPRQ